MPRRGRGVATASRTLTLITAVVTAVIVIAPSTAHADPVGPTDYRTEIIEITPALDGLAARILGGDSFLELTVAPGLEVIVPGYEGEDYLWFRADGTVAENQRSPATWYNRERFGAAIPESADPSAPPDWVDRASGGVFAWHDHRIHRMETFAPLNVDRGDQVLDAVVPIIVDDTPVEIRVTSTWMPAPSPAPAVAGLVLGLGLTALVAIGRRRLIALPVGLVALAATAVGTAQYVSLPAATAPRPVWWLAPLIALGAVVAAAIITATGSRSAGRRTTAWWSAALIALAGLQLVIWAVERRAGMWRAVLATPVDYGIDRLVTAAALGAGGVALVVGGLAVVRPGSAVPRGGR